MNPFSLLPPTFSLLVLVPYLVSALYVIILDCSDKQFQTLGKILPKPVLLFSFLRWNTQSANTPHYPVYRITSQISKLWVCLQTHKKQCPPGIHFRWGFYAAASQWFSDCLCNSFLLLWEALDHLGLLIVELEWAVSLVLSFFCIIHCAIMKLRHSKVFLVDVLDFKYDHLFWLAVLRGGRVRSSKEFINLQNILFCI